MKEEISVCILDTSKEVEDKTLQGIVDLYAKHADLSNAQKKERGLNSIENLKQTITEGIRFVVAENETGKVVGARMVKKTSENYNYENYWIYSLFTDPKERGRGVATQIEKALAESIQKTADSIRKKIFIAGGVELDNQPSINFHIKHGYEDWGTFDGEEVDEGKTFIKAVRKFEPEK